MANSPTWGGGRWGGLKANKTPRVLRPEASAAASEGDLLLGKNPGVTSPVLVWWLFFTAKAIMISNKTGRGRKDRAACGSRDGGRGAESRAPGTAAGTLRGARLPPEHLPRGRAGERRAAWGGGCWGGGARRSSGEISWAPRQACAPAASSQLGEAFIPGSERPAADWGAGEQLDYC